MRMTLILGAASLAFALASPAMADGLGGFDQGYSNGGNVFGKGYWGDGGGLALALPGAESEGGFIFDQPYSRGQRLFGTGFWALEYQARVAAETWSYKGHSYYGDKEGCCQDLPKPDHDGHGKHGDDEHEKAGHAWDKEHGHGGHDKWDHDKGGDHGGGHDKGHKPKEICKDDHHKPPKDCKGGCGKKVVIVKERERTRYVPFPVTERIVSRGRSTSVVYVSQPAPSIEIAPAPQQSAAFVVVCLDGKGDEHRAIRSTDRSLLDESYAGELLRCRGTQMLRVSYAQGALSLDGEIVLQDGSAYADCGTNEALTRVRGGGLVCAPKTNLSQKAENDLIARYGYSDGETYVPQQSADLSGFQYTGGVGH